MRSKILIALVIVVCLLTVNWWFGGKNFLMSNDSRLPFSIERDVESNFYSWSDSTAPGRVDAIKYTQLVPFGIISLLFYKLNLQFNIHLYQLLLYSILLFFSWFSVYYLVSVVYPKSSLGVRAVSGLVYAVNPYSMFLWIGLTNILIRYSFFPFVLGLLIRGLIRSESATTYKGSMREGGIVALAFVYLLSSGYGAIPFLFSDSFVLFIYFLIHFLRTKPIVAKRKITVFGITLLVSIILLSAYYLLPIKNGTNSELSNIKMNSVVSYKDSYGLYTLNTAKVSDNITYQGYFAFGEKHRGSPYYSWYAKYDTHSTFLVLIIPLVIGIVGMIKTKRIGVNELFFLGIVVAFLFLGKGKNFPFEIVNKLIFGLTPLGSLFRSAYQRFEGYVALGVSGLFAFGLMQINKRIK